jgi:hypothetical protein
MKIKLIIFFSKKRKAYYPTLSYRMLKTAITNEEDFEMPEVLYCKRIISDEEWKQIISQSSLSCPQGDCRIISRMLKLKLSGIGAIRVKGGVSTRFVVGVIEENTPSHIEHCWVEAKGIVYDWSQGRKVMMKKEVWYKMYDIRDVEIGIGTMGRFKDETYEGLTTPRQLAIMDNMNPKIALELIKD